MWMCVSLLSILVITAAAQSCPGKQIASDAQTIIHSDTEIPTSALRLPGGNPDPNLTFFSDVLGYSDDEIQQEVQNALQFFSERFGLDFSLTQPNEQGPRFFQNATLRPIRRVDEINAIVNRWILTGNTRTKIMFSHSDWWISCHLFRRTGTDRNIRWRRGTGCS